MGQVARTARIEARITPENLTVIRRAAEIQGRSLSEFLVVAAQDAAQKAITETQMIRLAVEDHRRIMAAIQNPPPLTPTMKRAIARYKSRITSAP